MTQTTAIRATTDQAAAIAALIHAAKSTYQLTNAKEMAALNSEILEVLQDSHQQYWIVRDESKVVAATLVSDEGSHFLSEYPIVLPGVGDQVVQKLIQQVRLMASTSNLPLEVTVPGLSGELHDKLTSWGFERGRKIYRLLYVCASSTPLPAVEWPAGFTIELVTSPPLDQYVFTWNAAFSDDYGDSYFTEEEAHLERSNPAFSKFDHVILKVNNEVAGMINTALDNHDGEGSFNFVGILPMWRRKGLGRALFLYGCHSLLSRGASHIRLGVDTSNPNDPYHLYTNLGFTIEESWQRFRAQ